MEQEGLLVIISGPAGSGKGTVARELVSAHPEMHLAVSATTRSPRPGEVDGVDYYYVTDEQFQTWKQEGKFFETNEYATGKRYGTLKSEITENVKKGDVILEIDVNGGLNAKKLSDRTVLIMLTPESKEILQERLSGRGTEKPEEVAVRMNRAKEEIALYGQYDYAVINRSGEIDACADEIYQIISSEHKKTKYQKDFFENFNK